MNSIEAFSNLNRSRDAAQSDASRQTLGQDEYLKLMIAQFSNQDPFKPVENGEFLAEIAQFGTVSGIQDLQDSFAGLAASISSEQTLQASGLIGRDVLVSADRASLGDGSQHGVVELPEASPAVQVSVTDANGQIVRTLHLGAQSGGLAQFEWDGRLSNGQRAPRGEYTYSAQAVGPGGAEGVGVLLSGEVSSVSMAAGGGLTLNFDNLDPQGLHAVREIS